MAPLIPPSRSQRMQWGSSAVDGAAANNSEAIVVDFVVDITDVDATCAAAAFIVIGVAAADDGDAFDGQSDGDDGRVACVDDDQVDGEAEDASGDADDVDVGAADDAL